MLNNLCGFVALFSIAVGTSAVIYALLAKSLGTLLDEVIRLPAGTTFYLRVFLIGLVLIALSTVLDRNFDLDAGSAVMKYVWRVAEGASSAFGMSCLFLMGFLIVVTVLVAVLRRRNDQ